MSERMERKVLDLMLKACKEMRLLEQRLRLLMHLTGEKKKKTHMVLSYLSFFFI